MCGIILYLNNNQTICNKQLTDIEYINHMIPHHEVAVYMSEKHLHNTKNPLIVDILIDVIRVQKYEIKLMKASKIINDDYEMINDITMDNSYITTQSDFTKPNTPYLSNTYCDPGFFDMSHNTLHNMTDEMYIQHMIPHHQVAVDMSKQILKTSNNHFIIYLAYRIIKSQQLEITILYYLQKSKNMYQSTIL